MYHYIAWLHELGMDEMPKVGGKNPSLGEMISQIAGLGAWQVQADKISPDAAEAIAVTFAYPVAHRQYRESTGSRRVNAQGGRMGTTSWMGS